MNSGVEHGLENGLTMILKSNMLGNFVYDPNSKSGNINGLRVVIHERDTYPSLMDLGIDVKPGQSTSIALKMKRFTRLDSPYGICQERNKFQSNLNFIYSEKLCTDAVKSKNIFESCGCKSVKYRVGISVECYR